MLLAFHDAVKLKAKKIIYEEGCIGNSATHELLKELTSRRKPVHESINNRSAITQPTLSECAHGLTSHNQKDLQKLEQYLPLLAHLHSYVECLPQSPAIRSYISSLKIQWSSALNSSHMKIGGPKFYRVDNLRFELGMSLFLYGAVLRERAFETLSTGELMESANLFRKAAGVYNYLAEKILPPLKYSLPKERPAEATSSLSSIMSIICLADAQALVIKKSEERGNRVPMLLSKLHYGITQMLDEVASILNTKPGELKDLSGRIKEIIYNCKVLHELRSHRYLAEDLEKGEKIGVGIAVLQHAIARANKATKPNNESYRLVFAREVNDAAKMLKKFEYDNDLVYHEKIPSVNMLPALQGTSIVKPMHYEVEKWEGGRFSF